MKRLIEKMWRRIDRVCGNKTKTGFKGMQGGDHI